MTLGGEPGTNHMTDIAKYTSGIAADTHNDNPLGQAGRDASAAMMKTVAAQTVAVAADLTSKGWSPNDQSAANSSGAKADNASHQTLIARLK